jgi:hypothetical protein
MLSYIWEVYQGIVIFARKASIYYARPGACNLLKPLLTLTQNSDLMVGRWLIAGIAKPPSVGVETQIETVRSAIRRVTEEAHAIMSKRIEITVKNITCMFTQPATHFSTKFLTPS